MDKIAKVLQAIKTGILVASFLLNSGRILEAIGIFKESLILLNNKGLENKQGLFTSFHIFVHNEMFEGYVLINDHKSAIECGEKLLILLHECGESQREGRISIEMAKLYERQTKYEKAKELYMRGLNVAIQTGQKKLEGTSCGNLATLFYAVGEYGKAEEYLQKALQISKEIGDKQGEATDYGNLAVVLESLGEYVKAEEYLQKALQIRKEIGDKQGEAADYGNLGFVLECLGEYVKAEEYLQKALQIRKEIGDKGGEAADYGNLGVVFQHNGEYVKAKEYHKKALQIRREIDDKRGEATDYGNLGTVFQSLSEYIKAEEYLQKALQIRKEIGDKRGEASDYGNLGTVFHSLGEYVKAEEHHKKALQIRKEIGDKPGEARDYGNLGVVLHSLGEYIKAEEYLQKALQIRKEIGHKRGEASDYGNLGTVLESLGEYVKAGEYLQKAIQIRKEIGDKQGEATDYGNLGTVFHSLGEYIKAEEYLQKALQINKEIGDRRGEAAAYGNLGTVFTSLGGYVKAEEYHKRALQIRKEIGDIRGKAADYGHLGSVFRSLGEYVKAEEYYRKALVIRKEIGDRRGETEDYLNLGTVFHYLQEYSKAKESHQKGLELSYEIGHIELQFRSHLEIALDELELGGQNINEAVSNLFKSIERCEEMRVFLRDKDQFKISFFHEHASPYHLLSALFCMTKDHREALYVVELGRARALADILSVQYSVELQISVSLLSWAGMEKIIRKESHCDCLYISYYSQHFFFWILKSNKAILFRQIDVNDVYRGKEVERSVDDVFGHETLRTFAILPEEQCEDRGLFPSNVDRVAHESPREDCQATSRLVEKDEDKNQTVEPLSLSQCYKMIIVPVADLLEEPEIVIVPDRVLYNVPFVALQDENGKFLSETFRIRIAPSLTTLKLIQDSPADYHSETGALIVGDPKVGHVTYKGRLEWISSLHYARKEAEMIGRLLGARPLIGKDATKQAVLDNIHLASLIHFAAHGNAERGEIALAPSCDEINFPQEEEYLLTMAEISQVRLTAKLVVLSCCHSARGQIRTEGVVGIARAFLGSGARSVLVALWAIQDKATEQFMGHFYKHLVLGESASESLHQAMKWMRANGFLDVEQWAPFMLIGDNVTFNFGK